MKLILTAAVDNLGVPGDIVEVKAGYGRNYLLPRGKAIVATPGAEKQIEIIKRAQQSRTIRDNDHAREVKEQLEALEGITLSVKTSAKGKMFGSVAAKDVAEAIKKAGGQAIDPDSIQIVKGEIKTTGKHSVTVALHADIVATVTFEVISLDK